MVAYSPSGFLAKEDFSHGSAWLDRN